MGNTSTITAAAAPAIANKDDDIEGNNNNSSSSSPAPVLFLSGDVHHGEISGREGYYEITSSGLTHHCAQSKLYGLLCEPLLRTYHTHRHKEHDNIDNNGYYIGLNYGILEITTTMSAVDDEKQRQRQVRAQIKNSSGHTVLEVTQPLNFVREDAARILQLPPYEALPRTWDGHFIPYVERFVITAVLASVISILVAVVYPRRGVWIRRS